MNIDYKATRGGSWRNIRRKIRGSVRYVFKPAQEGEYIGIRLVSISKRLKNG